jgi:parallel beta-helix repeat protein
MALPALAVDIAYVSARGTDVFPSGVPNQHCRVASPCRTIGHALSVVTPGSTIDIIASGTYDSFAAISAVTVLADPGVTATIDVLATTAGGTSITINAPGSDIVLRDLTVRVFGGDGIIINSAGTKVSLERLRIEGAGGANGINFAAGAELRIKNCTVSDMGVNGIQLISAGSAIFINDVNVHDNAQSGIFVSGQQTAILDRVRVEANEYGVYAAGGASVDIRNSTAADNGYLAAVLNAGGFIVDASAADTAMVISNSASLRNIVGVVLSSEVSPYHGYLKVDNSLIEGNRTGIASLSTGGGSVLTVTDTKILQNAFFGIYHIAAFTSSNAIFARDVVDQDGTEGILLAGPIRATLDGNVVSNNETGIYLSPVNSPPPVAYSRGNNTLFGNLIDVSGTLTPLGGF